jgi:hypothetical protein
MLKLKKMRLLGHVELRGRRCIQRFKNAINRKLYLEMGPGWDDNIKMYQRSTISGYDMINQHPNKVLWIYK